MSMTGLAGTRCPIAAASLTSLTSLRTVAFSHDRGAVAFTRATGDAAPAVEQRCEDLELVAVAASDHRRRSPGRRCASGQGLGDVPAVSLVGEDLELGQLGDWRRRRRGCIDRGRPHRPASTKDARIDLVTVGVARRAAWSWTAPPAPTSHSRPRRLMLDDVTVELGRDAFLSAAPADCSKPPSLQPVRSACWLERDRVTDQVTCLRPR